MGWRSPAATRGRFHGVATGGSQEPRPTDHPQRGRSIPRMSMTRGLPVSGYTDQPQDRIDQVNMNKATEEQLLRTLDLMVQHKTADPRWLAIARTHLEQAFMAWNRAIFRPERVTLPGDAGTAAE